MTIYCKNRINPLHTVGVKVTPCRNYGWVLGFVAEISTPQTVLKFQTKTA